MKKMMAALLALVLMLPVMALAEFNNEQLRQQEDLTNAKFTSTKCLL